MKWIFSKKRQAIILAALMTLPLQLYAIGRVGEWPNQVCANMITEKNMGAEIESNNQNIEIVKKYFEALQNGDMNLLSSLLSDDIVWHQPGRGQLSGTYRGKKGVFALFARFMEISKGSFKIDTVNSIMGNEDLVTATLRFSASNKNAAISMSGVDLMQVREGKIVSAWLFSENQDVEDNFWK